MSGTPEAATVHLVDDDTALLRSLSRLLATAGYHARAHASALQFLEGLDPDRAGCLVLDRRMPGADGHAVQSWLSERQVCLPVIFLTGAGDIASSVRAIKGGAVDYLTKPVAAAALFGAVDQALALDRERRERRAAADAFADRLESLTPREREVLDAAVAGQLNKQIAADLQIVEKTVKVHRARVMRKMGARSIAELVTMVVQHRDRI